MLNPYTRVAHSADGTTVEYLTVGDGPHVIVVPGALALAADLIPFASLLGQRHTVHVVQRRGRGGSGPQGDRYGIARECEDIEAVRAATGARLIFGHSFGGLVAVRAAVGSGAYDAVAAYEPGISVNGSIPADWIDRARQEVAAGADFEAFITFIRGVNPEETGRAPRWLLRLILKRAIGPAELRQNLALMPQAISEHEEVGRLDRQFPDYREVAAPTLIMRGRGRDTGRQAVALARLAETIPDTETVAFPKSDHFAPEKKPDEIAAAVLRFFAAQAQPGTADLSETSRPR
ncbi:MAG TPA: alpha/beta hydrolase [Trebonia sp.]|nr:alpha/beta hydrolase [Trebonia sp.]